MIRDIERIAEVLADIRRRNDHGAFAKLILGVTYHPGQQRWATNARKPENILVTGNRYGKSEGEAAKVVEDCVTRDGWSAEDIKRYDYEKKHFHAINIAMTADQSRIIWGKARMMLERPTASWLVRDIKETPFPRITFINGAVLEARSTAGDGERLLGNVYDRVSWDEAAFEKNFVQIRDNVIRMRVLDRRGKIDYISTGNGRNDFGKFFLEGMAGKNPRLYAQTGSSYENPYIPKEEIDLNASRISERMRRQNVLGEIVDAGGAFFDIDDLEACISEELTRALNVHEKDGRDETPMHAEVYIDGLPYHNKFHDHRFIHFWDLADKQDFVVGFTLDCSGEKMKVVEFERYTGRGWSYTWERIRKRHRSYQMGSVDGPVGSSRTYVDSTGVGDVAIDELKDIGAEGLHFSKQTKDDALAGLQSALSLRQIEMPMWIVAYDELKFYERDDANLTQDCVMSLAGAVHFGRRRPTSFSFDF